MPQRASSPSCPSVDLLASALPAPSAEIPPPAFRNAKPANIGPSIANSLRPSDLRTFCRTVGAIDAMNPSPAHCCTRRPGLPEPRTPASRVACPRRELRAAACPPGAISASVHLCLRASLAPFRLFRLVQQEEKNVHCFTSHDRRPSPPSCPSVDHLRARPLHLSRTPNPGPRTPHSTHVQPPRSSCMPFVAPSLRAFVPLCLPALFSLRSAWRSAFFLEVFSLFSRAQRVLLFSLSAQPPSACVPACLSGFLTFLTFSHVFFFDSHFLIGAPMSVAAPVTRYPTPAIFFASFAPWRECCPRAVPVPDPDPAPRTPDPGSRIPDFFFRVVPRPWREAPCRDHLDRLIATAIRQPTPAAGRPAER